MFSLTLGVRPSREPPFTGMVPRLLRREDIQMNSVLGTSLASKGSGFPSQRGLSENLHPSPLRLCIHGPFSRWSETGFLPTYKMELVVAVAPVCCSEEHKQSLYRDWQIVGAQQSIHMITDNFLASVVLLHKRNCYHSFTEFVISILGSHSFQKISSCKAMLVKMLGCTILSLFSCLHPSWSYPSQFVIFLLF